jgi:hypothetical protein
VFLMLVDMSHQEGALDRGPFQEAGHDSFKCSMCANATLLSIATSKLHPNV